MEPQRPSSLPVRGRFIPDHGILFFYSDTGSCCKHLHFSRTQRPRKERKRQDEEEKPIFVTLLLGDRPAARARVPLVFIKRITWNLVPQRPLVSRSGWPVGRPCLALRGRDPVWGKEMKTSGIARGKVPDAWRSLLGAHSPLPAPPSEDKDQPWRVPHSHRDWPPSPGASCPVGTAEAAESRPDSQPACSQVLPLGWPPPRWGAFRSPSASPPCLGVGAASARGAELLVSPAPAQGLADSLREPLHTPTSTACRPHSAARPALPAHPSVRPSVRGLAAPTAATGSLSENIQRAAWPIWRTKGSPCTPDARGCLVFF